MFAPSSPVMAKCSEVWTHFTKLNENAAKCKMRKRLAVCKGGLHRQPHETLARTTFYKDEAVQ